VAIAVTPGTAPESVADFKILSALVLSLLSLAYAVGMFGKVSWPRGHQRLSGIDGVGLSLFAPFSC